ncbi:MAG: hypothetical protein LBK24_01385 [Puniceicoccales bacterium]|nr:hypothetical protein [Puniceicoccales bacterium]
MSDIGNIDNDYIRKSPIEIVEILPMGMVELKIGCKLARICEPKPQILERGFVYLVNPDDKSTSWTDLIACDIPGFGNAKGVTDDPRLVDIGRKVFYGGAYDLKPGTIIPPLEKE